MNSLPDPASIHPRVVARYARHLALCSQLLERKGLKEEALLVAKASLTYIPENPDKHYELGNANFQTGLTNPGFLTAFGLITDHFVSEGKWEQAKSLLNCTSTLYSNQTNEVSQPKACSMTKSKEELVKWRKKYLITKTRFPFNQK